MKIWLLAVLCVFLFSFTLGRKMAKDWNSPDFGKKINDMEKEVDESFQELGDETEEEKPALMRVTFAPQYTPEQQKQLAFKYAQHMLGASVKIRFTPLMNEENRWGIEIMREKDAKEVVEFLQKQPELKFMTLGNRTLVSPLHREKEEPKECPTRRS